MNRLKQTLIALIATLSIHSVALGHCQIPCGIYDDEGRINSMREDITTIAKAMVAIEHLADEDDSQSINQRTRWILNKEKHASDMIATVSEYFLAQKVKPVAADDEHYTSYVNHLIACHHVIVSAMKTKQTVDMNAVENLRASLQELAAFYEKHEH